MDVARLRSLYARGGVTVEEFERRLEVALLREAPIGHPVPAEWEPLPPCEHECIDMTALGQRSWSICTHCGDER